MSDPHQQTSTRASTSTSLSFLLESLLEDVGVDFSERCIDSSSAFQYLSSESDGLDTRWTDCWDVVVESGVSELVSVQKKRKQSSSSSSEEEEFEASPSPSPGEVRSMKEQQQQQPRQRGKNWEKAEEDMLVECKSLLMDWKAVSKRLQEHGFVRSHKHCADKWYALRKHYLEVHQWMADHPGQQYWDRSNCSSTERIRSVPPSFCQKWYQVFDSVEHREGRKLTKLQVALNQHRNPENGGAVMDSQRDLLLALPNLPLLCNAKQTMVDRVECSRLNVMEELVKEIQNLRQALTWRFVVEEKERSRNLAIQEKKLELKRQRFDYQLQQDRYIFNIQEWYE